MTFSTSFTYIIFTIYRDLWTLQHYNEYVWNSSVKFIMDICCLYLVFHDHRCASKSYLRSMKTFCLWQQGKWEWKSWKYFCSYVMLWWFLYQLSTFNELCETWWKISVQSRHFPDYDLYLLFRGSLNAFKN